MLLIVFDVIYCRLLSFLDGGLAHSTSTMEDTEAEGEDGDQNDQEFIDNQSGHKVEHLLGPEKE